ncbi:hypothetical protein FYK55_28560 [Roseiconus nitratireducens]|uniref:Uncharacterized protein n=1 Tax=Roseiconus nitratireducens TaxID=2605748 RepID=A0A5M6CJM0_9BACT|nr:hypothetical protein [Roseiconus nitratireducens]KAA5535411.1 hypothetical protein FYK55_28560 [Roseiconus nitratireducens]
MMKWFKSKWSYLVAILVSALATWWSLQGGLETKELVVILNVVGITSVICTWELLDFMFK